MPIVNPQIGKPKKDTPQAAPDSAAGTTAPKDDFAPIRDQFNNASEETQRDFINRLSAEDKVDFGTKMGWFGHADTIKAQPKVGSIPWMKETAQRLTTWTANQLPTVGGIAGGMIGGAIGGGLTAGGGGEFPGAIVGSGVGGGYGEAARQFILHKQGYDKYDDPETKTAGNRFKEMVKQGGAQAAGEVFGIGAGKLLRPTLERSIAKLAYAGNLTHGADVMGSSNTRKVISALIATEKSGSGKALTVKDLFDVVHSAKNDIGQTVDLQYALPIAGKNGRTILLGQASPNPDPIINAIQSKLSSSPSVTVLAKIHPAGPEAAYLQRLKDEALNYSKHNWTYSELADRRIHLNEEIGAIYALPPGEKRVAMLASPDLAYKQAEADAIRDITYPEMDRLSGKPYGTTKALQEKRGALMSIENEIHHHLGDLQTKVARAQGANPWDKINASGYVTSSGKPGGAIHRVTSLVHTPNALARADKQVAKAFGNNAGTRIRGAISSPGGSQKIGNEILSLPLRGVIDYFGYHPDNRNPPKEPDSPDDQSSLAKPKDLIEKAKQLNPAATGQVAYNHVAVNPTNGHRVGSNDGKTWFDAQTGQQVA